MIVLDAPPLRTPDIPAANIDCVIWERDFAFVYILLGQTKSDDEWLTMIVQAPERLEVFQDETSNLGENEVLEKPDLFEDLYEGQGLRISKSTTSEYLLNYLRENSFVAMHSPDLTHFRIDTGWSELHTLCESPVQLLNGVIKPTVSFLDAH